MKSFIVLSLLAAAIGLSSCAGMKKDESPSKADASAQTSKPGTQPAGLPAKTENDKWFCKVSHDGNQYTAWGATQPIAKQNTKAECMSKTHEMNCYGIKCFPAQ